MTQNSFDQKKLSILGEINSTEVDLSPKGTIDILCLPIIKLINSHPDMVTTSSCSGRISVFLEGTKSHNDEVKVGGKGQGGRWLFVSHDKEDVTGWFQRLIEGKLEEKITLSTSNTGDISTFNGMTRYVLYKYEPFILHVKCRDFEVASRLYNTAMSCGFRESGIGSNNLVAIRINIKLDVPIGYLDESNDSLGLFVSEQYISLLDEMTLTKFNDNSKKMTQLYNKIDKDIINQDNNAASMISSHTETFEERRQRKMKEGLEKQRKLKEATQ